MSWPRSWDYPDEDEDEEMGSMGRHQSAYEEKLMRCEEWAGDMFDLLDEVYQDLKRTRMEHDPLLSKIRLLLIKVEAPPQ